MAARRRITFLYRLTGGVADRSFGLNVARMARLPTAVLRRAAERAAHMEAAVGNRQRCAHVYPSRAARLERKRYGRDGQLLQLSPAQKKDAGVNPASGRKVTNSDERGDSVQKLIVPADA